MKTNIAERIIDVVKLDRNRDTAERIVDLLVRYHTENLSENVGGLIGRQ